jgi:hypothetical protein
MRRRRRPRAARQARTYTINELLSRQPKTLQKHPRYQSLLAHYYASRVLQTMSVSRRCYSLLNRATVRPENLHHFLRTYRLPADPFFPTFFTVKRDYFAERERAKEERHGYILSVMKRLPEDIRAKIRYLGFLERSFNGAGLSPVWQKQLFPTSKRRADEYSRYGDTAWNALFRRHLDALARRYPDLAPVIADRVYASFVLDLVPEAIPPTAPAATRINRSYRRLSLLHHPDRGGDPAMFIEIKRARDSLLN